MDAIEQKWLDVFNKIEWGRVGSGKDYNCYVSLFYEFLRRSAIFSKKINVSCPLPWLFIIEALPEACEVSIEAENIINAFADGNPSPGQTRYIALALIGFILFEKARAIGVAGKKEKNIYSPLIKMFQLNGCFHTHHGLVEFDNFSQFPIRDYAWMNAEQQEPYIEFDEDFDKLF
jgi:hypothetical protein